jgi:T1SS-143 domain-containing protein
MIYVLLFDGEYWQLREDGVLVKLTEEQYQDLEQFPDNLMLVQGNASADSANQYDLTSNSSLAVLFAGLSRISPSLLPESGYETEQVKSLFKNVEQRPVNDSVLPPPIPADAEISVAIDDNGDGFVNTFEVSLVDIFGKTLNIFDRQPIVINLRDSEGLELEFITTTNNNQFSIPDADLSRLAQGTLIVTATAIDLYGNIIAATDQSIIDSLALITDDIVFNSGEVINAAEAASMTVSGSTSEIEAGQQVRIVYSDQNAREIDVFATIDVDGNYSAAGIDLSALADGPINVTLNSIDIPGNTVSRTTVITKDTNAVITVKFDGELPYHIADLATVTLSGQVTGVEPGQIVTVTVTDSVRSIQVKSTVLEDQSWQTSTLNLLTFNNGPLLANVSVADLAGNPALDNTETVLYSIPTDATITINIDDNGDGFINIFEISLVDIFGITTNIPDRLPIRINVKDSMGTELDFITTANDGQYALALQNLPDLAQGQLVVTASAIDFYGNTLSATDNSVIDTLALITDDIVFNSGEVINAAEATSMTVSGSTSDINVDQQVRIVYSDQNAREIDVFATIDVDGNYFVTGVDLSALADGPINVTLNSIDIPGNTVSRTTVITKDTDAVITVKFDGELPYYIADLATVTLSGQVTGVEPGQIVTVTVTDSVHSVKVKSTVLVDQSWQTSALNLLTFNNGPLLADVRVDDLAGNPAINNTKTEPYSIPTDATITINIEDNGDGFINIFEINLVDVFGFTTNIPDRLPIRINVQDSIGNELNFITTAFDGRYALAQQNFSTLAQGQLVVTASAIDFYGNTLSATDNSIIDTLASINDDIVFNSGTVINAAEESSVDISGSTSEIDAGQQVQLVYRDQNSAEIEVFTNIIDASGNYSTENVDLSSLAEGPINVTLNSVDVAGNNGSRTTVITKDTIATINVAFDGNLPYSADEAEAVTLSGTTDGVGAGRVVNVVITDGSSVVNTTAIVTIDGGWQTAAQNLSTFNDGTLSATANVFDLAGNSATDSTDTVIDTVASIDIVTDIEAIDINALRSGETVTINGTVTGVEIGRTVNLRFYDSDNVEQIFTTMVKVNGLWDVAVTVTDLGRFNSWQLEASVTDNAGNMAIDATPSLDIPTLATLSEGALISNFSYAVDSTIRIVGYDTLALDTDQTNLTELLFGGAALTVVVAIDGQSLTAGVGATDVLKAMLNGDDTVTITLFQPVDQSVGSDVSFSSIGVLAVQNDADGTNELVTVNIPIVIRDGITFTADDAYSAVEQIITSGNVFDNDVLLEGPLTIVKIEVAGITHDISESAPSIIADTKGSLTITADGSWSFIAARNLDNTMLQQLTFTYSALDQDDDFSTSDVVIAISDGTGGIFNNDTVLVVESDYDIAGNVVRNFSIQAGSDDLVPALMRFSSEQTDVLDALGYTSSGEALTYRLATDARTLFAEISGTVVFSIALTATAGANGNLDGTATLIQTLPVDHQQNDSLDFQIVIQAEDSDGTISSSQAIFQLLDGNDPVTSAEAGAVDESVPLSYSFTKNLTVEIGSDKVVDIGFVTELSNFPEITSGGVAVTYQVSAGGLLLTGSTDITVFTVAINAEPSLTSNSTPEYTFTLFQALDQLDDNNLRLDPLDLSFQYSVTDFDGDEVFSFINVAVTDGSGGGGGTDATGSAENIQLTESPKKLLNFNEPSEGTVNFGVNASKDPIVGAKFEVVNGATVLDSAGNFVTQNGEALTWFNAGDNIVQIRAANGSVVVTFSLPEIFSIEPGTSEDVSLAISMLQPIDHFSAFAPTDNITIALDVTFFDSDLTELTLTTNISILDGKDPFSSSVQVLAVDEDDIKAATASAQGFSFGSEGSDRFISVSLVLDTLLTSNGVDVTLAGGATADGWWIASASGVEVFRVKIDLDGSTEYSLSGPLDHANADGENDLVINFSASMNDADGDVSNVVNMTVNVTDDIPIDKDRTIKITEGAIKNINVLKNSEAGADGGTISKITYDSGMGPIDYTITTNPEVIDLMVSGDKYGTLTVYGDGRLRVETEITLSGNVSDSFKFEVTDYDGDVQVNNVSLDIRDEPASIAISPLSTSEDTSVVLTVVANPGDLDNNESIASISFAFAGLQGGSLTLDGDALPVDGSGNTIISGANLVINDVLTGEVSPNGSLVFTPALNTSDPTNQVVFDVVVTVNSNSGARTTDDSFDFSVAPIVDVPVWDGTANFVYNLQEDGGSTATNISANLFDSDGSESLSYRIEDIATGLILTAVGDNVSNGQVLSSSEIANLTIAAAENLSGEFIFYAVAVAKENSTGTTQELIQEIIVNISPVADIPTLSTFNVNTLEDFAVDLSTFISGALVDTDSSENLVYELEVPTGWQVVDDSGNEVGLQSVGVYRVTDVEVQASSVFLAPLEDISSVNETFLVDVTAISVESSVDGIAPAVTEARSATRTVSVAVKGVVDLPAIGAGPGGLWSFDGTKITATVFEDSLIPLNFATSTQDDDGSEVFDFVLRDLTADVAIVDVNGNAINLPVLGVFNNLPQYAVSAAQLASLYLQPTDDSSGQLTFQLLQTNTEPDGDSGTSIIDVDISIIPVIDTDNGISSNSLGGEDRDLLLNIEPPFADSDGSERLTNTIISSLPTGVKILVDFIEVDVPAGGLDLNQLAIDNGTTFNALIDSGNLRVRAPEDSDANFTIPVEFEVTDTSELGVSAVKTVSGSLTIDVRASVDDSPTDGITRIETPAATLTSTGGSIALDGAASFTEEDIDGSEYLDYIAITITNAGVVQLTGLFVSHPNGAINDGNGNWLIPANELTSTSLVDTASRLLDGATITSDQTGIFEIVVSARVLDRNDDADIIEEILNVEFGNVVTTGSASAVSVLQDTIVDGQEEQTIKIDEHVSAMPTGDVNDIVSYRVDIADMPYGGIITGTDVIARYAADGSTIVAFVFTNLSLSTLAISGIDEDFAGAFDLPINKVATDPNGATIVTLENLSVEVAPVIDDIADIITKESLEDIPLPLQYSLSSLLTDNSVVAAEGIEQITGVTLLLTEGSLSGPPLVLTEGPPGTYTVNDITQLDQVIFIPPANKHGAVSFDVELTIEDLTTNLTLGQTNPAISMVTQTIIFDVIAVTDSAPIIAINQVGSTIIEDNDISFTGLFVVDIDNDGSETLTMQMLGVPAGAILLWDSGSGSGAQQLINSGGDVTNGFTWTFDPSQLDGLVLRPPADFAGDITLSLQSTSMELSTLEVVTVVKDFTVAILPNADDAYFYNEPSDATGTEGNIIQVDVFGSTQEVAHSNETVVLSIVVDGTTSDATALDGLVGIRTPDGKAVNFVASDSNFVAVIATSLSQLEHFEFIGGNQAHGNLVVQINIGSKDSATVNGVFETDISDNAGFQSRNITINIAPEPDVPILTLTASTITAGEGFIPLGLSLEQINPAPEAGESADIVITGLPEGIILSDVAVQSGARWIVASADVASLAIKNADLATPFSITIEARSSLNGVTVVGGKQALTINVDSVGGDDDTLVGDMGLSNLIIGGKGDDNLTGGTAEDTYLFQLSDIGTVASPTTDTINVFDITADHIDLSDISGSLNSGTDLDTIIDLNESAGTTTLTIDLGAGLVQSIVLNGVSKNDLFGNPVDSFGNPISGSDAEILTQMLQDNVLLTG